MHKEIEKSVLRITQVMEKNRKQFLETEASYRDTGYDRYWNKMQKLDEEYEELKAFIGSDRALEIGPETIMQLDELKRKVKSIRSKWEHLSADLPASAESVGIDEIFKDIKPLLN